MATNDSVSNPKDEKDIANNDNDQIGENAGDSELSKGSTPSVQNKPDETLVDTVTPDNDSGTPGPSSQDSSNKDGGPAKENL